jgi:hypothetical protein
VHYDEMDSDYGAISKIIEPLTGGKYRNHLKAAQSRFTGYGAIRSMENQLAVAGLLQDAAKRVRGEAGSTTNARWRDLGIDAGADSVPLFNNIEKFARLNDKGQILELNINKWPQKDQIDFGVSMGRHAGQVVQMGFDGEMSAMMQNPWVAFMMQFRQYPMLAAEKQAARQLKFADREAAMGLFLNATSSSGARIIRYASLASSKPAGEREEYFSNKMDNLASDTWAYMGPAGMTPEISRYASQFLGHPFGIGEGARPVEGPGSEIPVLSWVTKLFEAHNGLVDGSGLGGDDFGRLMSAGPLGNIGYANLFAGIFRTGLGE